MTMDFIRWVGYATILYFVLMQLYLVGLALLSGYALRRNYFLSKFGRINEMLSSKTTPPMTLVVPAYNEEAGIVDAVRSMSIVGYPRFEIVIVNDGSKDNTLQALIDAFHLELVRLPYRPDIETAQIRGFYRGRGAVDITVIDKENGGRADALNAGINAARYPYVLTTDADVIIDADGLIRGMQRIIEDRDRTIGVGGNVRPLNGSDVRLGHLISASVPRQMIPRMQVLEYIRTFLASRPGWSEMGALPLVSGAFGIWKRSALLEIGGYESGHLGEDLDLTMRLHKHFMDQGKPYRIVYEPSAVLWTEVPQTVRVLKRQRIRWHRGLMRATKDFFPMLLRPKYGRLGMITWPGFFFFEFLAPILEAIGYLVVPIAYFLGVLNTTTLILMLLLAFGVGLMNSLIALWLDEPYGFFNGPSDSSRLIVMALAENFGFRQMTVYWRMRALFGGRATKTWGNMERQGLTKIGGAGGQDSSSSSTVAGQSSLSSLDSERSASSLPSV